MWKVLPSWPLRNHSGIHSGRRTKHSHHSFYHPNGLERLEERLPLSVAPGTSTPGSVPGSASSVATAPASGTDPVNPIEGQNTAGSAGSPVLGNAQNDIAFNTPSYIPADRPPIPFTEEPGSNLPFNIYQTASTPFGIRNFEIGPNTSMAHGGSPVLPSGSRFSRPTMTIVDELGVPMFAQMSAIERHALKADGDASADDLPLASIEDIEVAQSPSANPSPVNETAIDSMMSDEASIDQMLAEDFLGGDALADKIAADRAFVKQTTHAPRAQATLQQVETDRPDDGASSGTVAATVAVAMGVPTHWTERRNWPDSDSWRKDTRFRPRRP